MFRMWSVLVVLAVVCAVGVSAVYAGDAPPPDKKKMDPGAMFDRLAGEGKTELTKDAFTASRLGKMLGEKAGEAWKALAGDKDKLNKEQFLAAVKDKPNWLRDFMPARKGGRGPGKRGEKPADKPAT